MDDSMVTARMLVDKKRRGARILVREGLSASQAINLMYDKMIEEGEAGFLRSDEGCAEAKWAAAANFVDGLSSKRSSRFDDMTKAEAKMDRLRSKGLV